MDFTLKREPHTFTIDEDTFSVPQILAAYNLRRVAAVMGRIGGVGNLLAGQADPQQIEATLEAIGEIFLALIPGAQGERFVARLNSQGRPADEKDGKIIRPADPPPIDLLRQAVPVLFYLLECYGLRPTSASSIAASSSSDATIPSNGTPSEAGPSASVSQSIDLTPPNTST